MTPYRDPPSRPVLTWWQRLALCVPSCVLVEAPWYRRHVGGRWVRYMDIRAWRDPDGASDCYWTRGKPPSWTTIVDTEAWP